MQINEYIDHTLLKPTATPDHIITLCDEAKQYEFVAVCVNGCYVTLAKEQLLNSEIKIASVIGFPLGAMATNAKVFEASQSVLDGADEIDMVINLGLLKAKAFKTLEHEILEIKKEIGDRVLKVIFETCYLTDTEIKIACKLSINAGADYIKTSTGFGSGGATFDTVKLMKAEVKDQLKIKASGGIKNTTTAKKYIDLGVSRIGTSSGIQIVLNPQ
ncbi:deoxyribose-phosphate aldolase [Lacinutrix neustonica]|uniref:Deoxyribose-phosphate aldolase n=1 Tax=Lacinutrix neustonica TaxID=2980107 RepID=A0A9E8MYW2_9FLAO|nr:deoxyribose-phosphate aldolase [Lacinutrix neustonica]WAC02789.1 deoxyribose-phosphate aldolase [Lacinutrix neustonica]